MPTGLSFDPRTWLAAPPAPAPGEGDAEAQHRRSGEPPRATWLALGISVGLLAAGALTAYATREAAPEAVAQAS